MTATNVKERRKVGGRKKKKLRTAAVLKSLGVKKLKIVFFI